MQHDNEGHDGREPTRDDGGIRGQDPSSRVRVVSGETDNGVAAGTDINLLNALDIIFTRGLSCPRPPRRDGTPSIISEARSLIAGAES